MKAAFHAEAIGWDEDAELRMLYAMAQAAGGGAQAWLKPRSSRPWVAEVTGPDPRYGLARTFLPHKTDYRDANRKGSRGVMFWWTLESGHVYEARYRASWTRWERRFLTVDGEGNVSDLSEDEVTAWASVTSAPTS